MASRLSFAGFDSSDVLEGTGNDSPGGLTVVKKKTDLDHVFKIPQVWLKKVFQGNHTLIC